MQGHAASNIIPVVAANRIGKESVKPTTENTHQESSLTFYGYSFMTDELGAVVQEASKVDCDILYYEYDIEEIRKMRLSWGVFRDRRPEYYEEIVKRSN